MLIFPILFVFHNKVYHIFSYFREMAVFLNNLYNINYAFVPIFFWVMVLSNTVLDFFFRMFAIFSAIKNIILYHFIKSLKLLRSLIKYKIMICCY